MNAPQPLHALGSSAHSDEPWWINAEQIAALIGRSVCTVHRRVKCGDLPGPVDQGGPYLWSRAEVYRALEAKGLKPRESA